MCILLHLRTGGTPTDLRAGGRTIPVRVEATVEGIRSTRSTRSTLPSSIEGDQDSDGLVSACRVYILYNSFGHPEEEGAYSCCSDVGRGYEFLM